MSRSRADLRRLIFGITIVLFLAYLPRSWAANPVPNDGICDANADYSLGLEDYPAAIVKHRQVLRAHNDNALAHYHLGFAYGMTGRTTEEISEYLAAARLRLNQWDLFLNLGLAYLSQNDLPRAIGALETAVSLGPNHSETHFNLAIAYERDNRSRDALEEITASLHLAPQDPDEHNTRAIICAEAGDLVCARDEWSYLVHADPEYAPARVNLAILSSGSHVTSVASTPGALNHDWFASAR